MSFDPNDFAGETREDYHADLARIDALDAAVKTLAADLARIEAERDEAIEREALSASPVIQALEGFTRGYAAAYRLPKEAA